MLLQRILITLASLTSAFKQDHCPKEDSPVEYQAEFSLPAPSISDSNFTTLTLSTSPLLIYLSSFLSLDEATHLLELCQDSYFESLVITDPSSEAPPLTYRTSTSCTLPNDDTVVIALTLRVFNFIRSLDIQADGIEPFQAVRYLPSQHYSLHYDYFDAPIPNADHREYNRLASFFLYLDANCSASGWTYFPRISMPGELLDEEEKGEKRFGGGEDGKGVVFRPVIGNGVFWLNLKGDGEGDERVLHAGLPVEEGNKVGLNIWLTRFAS